jgi:predicted nucleic-acid-binding protein
MGRPAVKITADTNLIVRVIMQDDAVQSAAARRVRTQAELVVLTLPTLCEFVWVLSRGYKVKIVEALRRLTDAAGVAVDRPAVEAGLALLEAGGDFADGVIAYLGAWAGAETFVSFDRAAVERLTAQGVAAKLLS